MEYISKESARKRAIEIPFNGKFHKVIPLGEINTIPAADVRPVVKAAWKRIDFKPCGHDYECSSCGGKNDMATHFCPNCGADMRDS